MNTLQNVYDKLADKTELAKHDVELADLKSLENRLKDIFVYEKKLDVINPKLIDLNKQKQDAVSQLKSILRNSEDTLAEFLAQAKELGLDPSNVPAFKALKNETDIVKEYIK
jgi:oligoendopeptidase F